MLGTVEKCLKCTRVYYARADTGRLADSFYCKDCLIDMDNEFEYRNLKFLKE